MGTCIGIVKVKPTTPRTPKPTQKQPPPTTPQRISLKMFKDAHLQTKKSQSPSTPQRIPVKLFTEAELQTKKSQSPIDFDELMESISESIKIAARSLREEWGRSELSSLGDQENSKNTSTNI